MDEVVALSSALRARQLDADSPLLLDDIPHLTRALTQIHADSTRLLTTRTASSASSTTVHAPALRLFSSVGFAVDKLRRGVQDLENGATFVDSPLRHSLPLRHPTWLTPRALDDARLSLNASLRNLANHALESDLRDASRLLVASLAARPHPSAMYAPHHHPSSARLTPQQHQQHHQLTHTQSQQHQQHTTSSSTTPLSRRSRTSGVHTPTHLPPVAAATLPQLYVKTVHGIATGGADGVVVDMLDSAEKSDDSPHFIHALQIVSRIYADSPYNSFPIADTLVWAPRHVLEQQMASRIPSLPENPHLAAPSAVIQAVETYVKSILTAPRAQATSSGPSLRPTVWACAYYCLRVGCVTAAAHLLRQRGRAAVAEHFLAFLNGRRVIQEAYLEQRCLAENRQIHEHELRTAAMPPGSLIGAEKYDAVAADFRASACTSDDPFMRLCYILLMRLELRPAQAPAPELAGVMMGMSNLSDPSARRHDRLPLSLPDQEFNLLFQSVEDYFWFRLWLCRTPCEENLMAVLPNTVFVTPLEIQHHVKSIGSSHFDSDGAHPLVYALVLVSAALYEEAISYLANHPDEHWMHYAVHFAMVLYHQNWLKDIDAYHALLTKYTTLVAKLNPSVAAMYLMTVRDRAIVERSLYDLVVNTGEYQSLLGTGEDTPEGQGVLVRLVSEATKIPSGLSGSDLRKLRVDAALHGANEAAARSDYAAAASLYVLAEHTTESYEMHMRDLAEEVDKLSSSRRSLALARSKEAVTACKADLSSGVDPRLVRTLEELIRMARVFEDNWTGRLAAAWVALREVETLPLKDTEITTCHRKLTSESDMYGSVLKRALHELLKVSLHIAEYALETGSVRREHSGSASEDSRMMGGGRATRSLGEEDGDNDDGGHGGLPLLSEIKRACIFAALLGVTDSGVNEQIVRIEAQLSKFGA